MVCFRHKNRAGEILMNAVDVIILFLVGVASGVGLVFFGMMLGEWWIDEE